MGLCIAALAVATQCDSGPNDGPEPVTVTGDNDKKNF